MGHKTAKNSCITKNSAMFTLPIGTVPIIQMQSRIPALYQTITEFQHLSCQINPDQSISFSDNDFYKVTIIENKDTYTIQSFFCIKESTVPDIIDVMTSLSYDKVHMMDISNNSGIFGQYELGLTDDDFLSFCDSYEDSNPKITIERLMFNYILTNVTYLYISFISPELS